MISEKTVVEIDGNASQDADAVSARIPRSFPTPTLEYRSRRKLSRAAVGASAPPVPSPVPVPLLKGPRVLIWKQDPTVGEIGFRRAYLPGVAQTGPKDARIVISGLAPVVANAFGDFIQTPGTDAFDAVHTFAVVRETLTMYQRALGTPVPWQWNTGGNTDPISVFPHAGVTQNAFYSRGERAMKFFQFPTGTPPHNVFTCRSFDIVAHETGHAVLDGMKPNWLLAGNPPQTGALHESFGDLTAVFLALSQLDQVEAVIAQTKANLHDKTFLSDLAEEFGLALGRPNGLRNADNDFRLSDVGTEVHALSQVMTGGIYDFLADVFVLERNDAKRDPAAVLYDVGRYVYGLYVRALSASPSAGATFAHVVNQMLSISAADGKPATYRNSLRNRFTFRQVVVSPTPLVAEGKETSAHMELAPDVTDAKHAVQNRSSCCGTMQLGEFAADADPYAEELEALRRYHPNGSTTKKSK